MEPKRLSIRWRGAPILEEGEPLPLVPPGYVLLRVRYASWTGVEEAIRASTIPSAYGIVMGASGAGQPLEAAGPVPSARLVAQVMLGEDWVPGLYSDGWLTTYTVAPLYALEEAPDTPYAALSLYFSLACEAIEKLKIEGASSLLVVGAGVSGYSAALLAAEEGFRVGLYTGKKLRCSNPCIAYSSIPSNKFDAVFAATPSKWLVEETISKTKAWLLLMTPFSNSFPTRHGCGRLTAYTLRGLGGGCWRRLVAKFSEEKGPVVKTRGLTVPPFIGDAIVSYVLIV